jgi:hypothetical protein
MIILPDTTLIEIVLAAAGTAVQFVASAVDDSGSSLSYYNNDGASNGTTPVTVVAAPAPAVLRTVRYIEIVNTDSTETHTVTVRQMVSAVSRVSRTYSLAPGESIFYTGSDGWKFFRQGGAVTMALVDSTLEDMRNAVQALREAAQGSRVLSSVRGILSDLRVSVVNTPAVTVTGNITTVSTVTTTNTLTNQTNIGGYSAAPKIQSLMNNNFVNSNIANFTRS